MMIDTLPCVLLDDDRGLLFVGAQMLDVNGLHHFLAVGDGGFLESLTGADFFDHTGLFGFTFEFLQGAFDVFAFFYGYDNHDLSLFFKFLLCNCFEFSVLRVMITDAGCLKDNDGVASRENWIC